MRRPKARVLSRSLKDLLDDPVANPPKGRFGQVPDIKVAEGLCSDKEIRP